jgi:DNA-directed RNA polymerase subunit H (RpoH/RPB5)
MLRIRGYLPYGGKTVEDQYRHLSNPELDVDAYINHYYGIGDTLGKTEVLQEKEALRPILKSIAPGEMRIQLRNSMSDLFWKPGYAPGDLPFYCIVFFANTSDSITGGTSREEVSKFIDLLGRWQDSGAGQITGVLITPGDMTPGAAAALASINLNFTHFTDEEILFNPLDHVYSARTRVLTPMERADFLTRNRLKPGLMPRIYSNEPTIKYLGATPDDIVESIVDSLIPGTLSSSEVIHRVVRRPQEKKRKVRN